MRKLLIGFGLVVGLVIVALIAAPFFISVEQFKPQIQAAVDKTTGRTLAIDGPITLSMFPPASLTVSDVRFSNMKGAPQPDMASLKEMRLRLKVLPLLSGKLVVDEFVLEEPTIALYVDKNGKPNWQLDMAPAESGQTALPTGLTLGDVRINGGSVTYENAQNGAKHAFSDVDLKLGLDSMTSPLSLEAGGVWDGKPVRMTMSAENFSDLLAKGTGLTLALASDLLKLDYKGTLGLGGGLQAAGTASLDIPSLTALAAAGGAAVEAQKGTLQRFAVSGKVSAAGTKYAFTEAKLALDKIEGSGGVTIDTAGKVPSLSGRLDIANLDLRPYLPPPAAGANAPAGGAPAPAPTEWSDAPITIAGLDAVKADFDLTVGAIQAAGLEIGRSAVKLLVNNGRLNATLSDFNLYGGRGQGQLSVSGEGGVSLASRFTLEGIQIEPLLAAASNFRKLTGTGRLSYDITARGGSQRALMRGLNGRVETNLRDGAIKGIDLAAMSRNIAGAFLTGDNAPRQTDFAELAGSLTIVNGVGTNNDLRMVNPFVRLSGAGTVNIAEKTVKYRIEPRLVASAEGQGAQSQSGSGLGVPILVEGPWAKLSYKPDLGGAVKNVLSNPQGAVDAVKGVRDAVKGGSPTDALKGLFGR
jgi:AsmA protein